ncbi:MAG TPA: alpha/beta hydrolase [Ohtaekwangia sp.]|nr:alpha/beta hydrolase [Ohtaekwangia sp.]
MIRSVILLVLVMVHIIPVLAQNAGSKKTHEFKVVQNVEWAKPDGISLTMDIYTPQTGKSNYPVYVIFHGGGWLINNESIMDEMSQYMAAHGEYVICNVNYRLLPQGDNSITMNQIVEDGMGAVLWIKNHIEKYKGNSDKIAVSGDSAGGHLAAMVSNAGNKLESDGYAGPTLGFRPTYLPPGKTAEQVAQENGLSVQAVVLNYPATDIYRSCFGSAGDGTDGFEHKSNIFWQLGKANARGIFGDSINVRTHPDLYKMVSPIYLIPHSNDRKLAPHFCAVGSHDDLTTPGLVQEYVDALKLVGQEVTYWEHMGRPHAYLDSGSNQFLGTSFEKDAPIAIDQILSFLDSVFYSTKNNR